MKWPITKEHGSGYGEKLWATNRWARNYWYGWVTEKKLGITHFLENHDNSYFSLNLSVTNVFLLLIDQLLRNMAGLLSKIHGYCFIKLAWWYLRFGQYFIKLPSFFDAHFLNHHNSYFFSQSLGNERSVRNITGKKSPVPNIYACVTTRWAGDIYFWSLASTR